MARAKDAAPVDGAEVSPKPYGIRGFERRRLSGVDAIRFSLHCYTRATARAERIRTIERSPAWVPETIRRAAAAYPQ